MFCSCNKSGNVKPIDAYVLHHTHESTLSHSLGQLTGVVQSGSDETPLNTRSFVYDQISNRISAADETGKTFYTANSLNQYTEIDQQALTYDADGNPLTTDAARVLNTNEIAYL